MNNSSLSTTEGVEKLSKKLGKEWEEKILDALLRIAFRPGWNYTGTILRRRDTDTKLWQEVERYLEVKQGIQPREFLKLKREIERMFLEEVKLDLVTLYTLPGPSPSRPGAVDCYNKWYKFQQEVLAGMEYSVDKYVENSLKKLSEEEKDIIRSILRCFPVPEHTIVYDHNDPEYYPFNEEIMDDYQQEYGKSLDIKRLSNAIIRAGLGDWAGDQLCLFTKEITYPPKFIVEYVDIEEFLSLKMDEITSVPDEISGLTVEDPRFTGKEDETALLEFTIRNHEPEEKTFSIEITTGFHNSKDLKTGNYKLGPLSESNYGPYPVGTPHFARKSEPIRIEIIDAENTVIYEQLIKVNVQRSMKRLLFNILFSRFRLR